MGAVWSGRLELAPDPWFFDLRPIVGGDNYSGTSGEFSGAILPLDLILHCVKLNGP